MSSRIRNPEAPRILVIEDDIAFQKLIRQRLKKRWPKADIVIIDPTRGGKLGPDFKGTKFDIVLSDYEIGPWNGLELLKEFRKVKNFPPVIMITGAGDEGLAVKVMRAGAADYIPKKDLTQETLIGAVEQALGEAAEQAAGEPEPEEEPLPDIEGYEVAELIGRVKTGRVYRARRVSDGLEVALKVVLIDDSATSNDELIERCLREFTLMKNLDSPRVARIYEQRFDDNALIVAAELLRGGSLRDLIRAGPIPKERVWELAKDIAQALDDIHGAGVIHRDLKPSNIMLREGGGVALIDFGIAKDIEDASNLTRVGEMLGTPAYVSPEQGTGKKVDDRTDIYSLGVIFYEMLSGEAPYRALTHNAVIQKHIHSPLPELPPDLWLYEGLITRTMAKSPGDRFPTGRAFIEALDALNPEKR